MAIEKHTYDNNGNAIYAETANINYFLSTGLEPDSVSGVEERTKNMPQRSVRRYVGDPEPYTIPAVTGARYLYDPGRKNSNATPGKEFILDDGTEKRVFSYTGAFVDLHAFILGDAKMDLTLFSEGAWYEVKVVGNGAAEVAARKK